MSVGRSFCFRPWLFWILAGAVTVAAGEPGVRPQPTATELVAAAARGEARIVDLTYALGDGVPAWPGDQRTFEAEIKGQPDKDGYFSRSFWTLEHFGTHLDAPAHFPPGKTTVDEILPERLLGSVVLIDIRQQAAESPDYRLNAHDVQSWEERHGQIPAGAIVLARTGWSARWPDEARYRNQDADGVMHFPGFSVGAVEVLIERKVSGLGIDTLSVDYGPSSRFEVHRRSHGAGLYHLENLADLSLLPESGAFLIVAPIKLQGGSGGPVRVFAVIP